MSSDISSVTYQVGSYNVNGDLMLAANVKVAEQVHEDNQTKNSNQIPE